MDNTERRMEGSGGIIHPVKKQKKEKIHSYKVSKSRGRNTKSTKLCWEHNHTITGEMMGRGWQETLQAFLKSEFTLQITFTEYIYIYCIYIYIHTEKIFPKEKKVQHTTRNAMMQGEIKSNKPKMSSAGKRSIIVLFTDAPGHLLPTYKNTILFLFFF